MKIFKVLKKWWNYNPQVEAFKRGYKLGKAHMKERMLFDYKYHRDLLDEMIEPKENI